MRQTSTTKTLKKNHPSDLFCFFDVFHLLLVNSRKRRVTEGNSKDGFMKVL